MMQNFSWNVRGMNDPTKQVEIKKFINHNKLRIVGLSSIIVRKYNKRWVQIGDGRIITVILLEVGFGWGGNKVW